jgi:hypothetical protein
MRDGQKRTILAALSGSPFIQVPDSRECSEETEPRIKSYEQDITSIIFRNLSASSVNIFVRDMSGHRQLKRTLRPKETYSSIANAADPWIVTDSDSKCKGIYYSRKGSILINVR